MYIFLLIIVFLLIVFHFTNVLSYKVLKNRYIKDKKWDLNICCGKTDGGGINVDIVKHANLPKLVIVDVYNLPFKDDCFNTVLCSHTIEHVFKPEEFYKEMKRVGKNITLILPPLWDFTAAFNLIEHRWVFLTFKKKHYTLPRYVKLPLAEIIQEKFFKRIHA